MGKQKFKRCFLHIGATKTGSSSIQSVCTQNREILEEHGVYYPHSADGTHGFLAAKFRDRPEEMWAYKSRGLDNRGEVLAHIEKQVQQFETGLAQTNASTLVLSSELFPSTQKGKCVDLRDYLHGLADQVTIVFYVRHPVAQYSSSLQQGIKKGMETLDNRRSYRFYAAGVSRKFQSVFGKENMCVREYARPLLHKGDSVADFMQVIGLPEGIELARGKETVNEGLSHEGVLLADSFNRQFPVRKDGKLNPERSSLVSFTGIPGPKFFDAPASLARIADECADDIAYMRQEYGLSLKPPEIDRKTDRFEWNPATIDAVARKLNELGLQVEEQRRQLKKSG